MLREIITRNKVYFHNQQNFTELAGSDVLYFVESRDSSCGLGSSVGIGTELRVGRSGIESRGGRDFPPSRPALGPSQLPVEWLPAISRG